MDSEKLKDIVKKLLQNELEEIKQNRFRVLALIFFTILSIGFMFLDDEETQIALDEPVQIEQEIIESAENKKSEKKPVIIKKKHDEYSEVKVLPVIGANSDELYISDPFALKEKSETTEENDKEEVLVTQEIPVITQQIAPIPALTPITPDNLPPIPEPDIALLLQQDKPILPENKEPAEEFILTGTAISGDNKLALVKKVSSTPNSNYHDESIIVKIGDSIQGQQITDIVDSKLILNNGENYMRISGFINSGDDTDEPLSDPEIDYNELNNAESDDIPIEYLEKLPGEKVLTSTENENFDLYLDYEEILSEDITTDLNIEEIKIIPENNKDSFIDDEVVEDDFISHEIDQSPDNILDSNIMENVAPADLTLDLSK